MSTTQPSLDEWRRLYQAAAAFKEAGPWEWMIEDEIFGVRNPQSKEIGYCSIMGMAGEHFALAVYLGSEGLAGFWRLHGDRDLEPTFLLEVPELQASWEDRRQLHKQDLDVIKSLGLKFRGRNAWPMFRSYAPGFFPWFVTAEEARFLTLALEQTVEVASRIEEEPALLDPLREGLYLVRTRVRRGESLIWEDEWIKPAPPKARPLPPSAVTEADLADLRRLPRRKMILEIDLFGMPTPIKEKDDPRPYLPYNLLTVEARSGMILGTDLLAPKPSLSAVWTKAPAAFVKTLQRSGSLPAEVVVCRERVYRLLEPVTSKLGIRLTQKRRLTALEQARAAMEQWMG